MNGGDGGGSTTPVGSAGSDVVDAADADDPDVVPLVGDPVPEPILDMEGGNVVDDDDNGVSSEDRLCRQVPLRDEDVVRPRLPASTADSRQSVDERGPGVSSGGDVLSHEHWSSDRWADGTAPGGGGTTSSPRRDLGTVTPDDAQKMDVGPVPTGVEGEELMEVVGGLVTAGGP